MAQLREFAQHEVDFNNLDTRVVTISVDNIEHNRDVWESILHKKFPVLSDRGAVVIRRYGLLNAAGKDGNDIAIRTTLLLDAQGIEQWRRVSKTASDIPKAADILRRIRKSR